MKKKLKVGIDLGTTNTVVCYLSEGGYKYLKFGREYYLPSVILVEPDKENIIVGQKAENMSREFPERFIRSAKTHMGEFGFTYPDSVEGMRFGRRLDPTDVAANVLGEVKRVLDGRLGAEEELDIEAVITVPAYFSGNQIDATKKAASDAGLKVKKTVCEPTAAAVAYVTQDISDNTRIFVVDFGGGTLDLTVLRYDKASNKYSQEVIGGNNHLGGDNIDSCLLNFIIQKIEEDDYADLSSLRSSQLSLEDYSRAMWLLKREVKEIKHSLSKDTEYEIYISDLYERKNGTMYSFEYEITREEFEEACAPVLNEFRKCIDDTIRISNIDPRSMDQVILVGGSCYINKVQEIVGDIFGTEPRESDLAKVVALGACIIANEEFIELSENIAFDLGVEVVDKENGFKPRFDTLIRRNTMVPCRSSKTYTTTVDNQRSVRINVYERGGYVDDGNRSLELCDFFGSLTFEDFKKGKKGEPQIEVGFEYDSNRILTVSVTDLNTGAVKEVQLNKSAKIELGKSQEPMDFVLMIDVSLSMNRTFKKVTEAVEKLVTDMIDMKVHRVGIVKFAEKNKAATVCPICSSSDSIIKKVGAMKATGSSTYISKAINLSVSELLNAGSDRKKVIIMLTDGIAHDATFDIENAVKNVKNSGVRLITIGAGSFKKDFLRSISSVRSDGSADTYDIDTMDKLRETFRAIIDSLGTIDEEE